MHADPKSKTKAFVMLYNPLKENVTRTIQLPLYYTGITQAAMISKEEAAPKKYTLNREYEATLTFTIKAESYTWFIVE